ncbi:MAG: oxidoreductase [Pseudomonadota bacterium]
MTERIQAPLSSGFHAKSTALEVVEGIDLRGKTAIVTGGYSGIGLETVRALVTAGATVWVPARRPAIAREALQAIDSKVPGRVRVQPMDLADIGSVNAFVAAFLAEVPALHLLINNAGIMACPLTRVGPGWESQFGVNHLGHFALAVGLKGALEAAGGARIVALSSTAHIRGDVLWDDPHFKDTSYDKWRAYAQAKSANALFALGADNRWQAQGIRAFSVHPGGIFTPLQRHLSDEEMTALGWKNADGSVPPQVAALFKTPEQGASTTLFAATSPALEGFGGLYCEDGDVAAAATDTSPPYQHARPWILDSASAERLWEMSETMLAAA